MNYYVVSPNVYNDGDNYAQKMFSKGIAAVGWDTDRQKGQQFDSITQGDCIIVAQRVDWQWTYYYMGIVLGNEDKPSYGTLSKRLSPIISLDGIDLNFEDWTANGSNQVPSPQRIDINSNINIIENIKKIFNMQKYTDLLKSNYNLILTGAPGTGKTYLAKQIAQQIIFGEIKEKMSPDEEKQFNERCGFVQFHPSYDYTDFVEGLRPKQDDNGDIGFERRNGVFKDFCARAKTKKTNKDNEFDEIWNKLLTVIRENLSNGKLTKIGNWEYGLSTKESLKYSSINTPSQYSFTITKKNIWDAYCGKQARPSGAFQKDMNDIVQYLKQTYKLSEPPKTIEKDKETTKPYIFIIDEINRGEISKIFGELFFSIDPGYRGTDGKVKTQYQNLIEEDDEFYEGFFVPENVYIIGTMNDIDRGVESMDFAFRRRFAFKEITAKDSKQMLDSKDAWGKDKMPKPDFLQKVRDKMNAINKVIFDNDEKNVGIEGLSSAYHIGASYFLKLANYRNENGEYDETSFSDLWDNHLEGLLREYMRGMQGVEDKIETLKKAYNNPKATNTGDADENL